MALPRHTVTQYSDFSLHETGGRTWYRAEKSEAEPGYLLSEETNGGSYR